MAHLRHFDTSTPLEFHAAPPVVPEPDSGSALEVNVLFTGPGMGAAALRAADRMAQALEARIRVIVPQVVPFPLPLAKPAADPEFAASPVQAIAAALSLDVRIEVCLCRALLDAALSSLRPGSLVLIGGRRRLWPTLESRLAARLRRHGHQVLLIDRC